MSNQNITLRNLRTMERRWRRRNKVQSETETVFRETVADHFKAGADEIDRLLGWIKRWNAFPVVSITFEDDFSADERGHEIPQSEVKDAIDGKTAPARSPRRVMA